MGSFASLGSVCHLVAKLRLTLCDLLDCSTPGFPARVQPLWIQRNSKGRWNQRPRINLFNYRNRERLETDSVVGNIGGEKEAE